MRAPRHKMSCPLIRVWFCLLLLHHNLTNLFAVPPTFLVSTYCMRMHACMLSHFFATPWTKAHPRLLCPRDSPGKNARVGYHFLLQGIFPTQELSLCLLYCRRILYSLTHLGSPPPLVCGTWAARKAGKCSQYKCHPFPLQKLWGAVTKDNETIQGDGYILSMSNIWYIKCISQMYPDQKNLSF